MNKLFLLLSSFFSFLIYSQQISIQHALTTKDQKVMVAFLKANPTHTEAPLVRQRLRDLLSGKDPVPLASKTAKTASSPAEGLVYSGNVESGAIRRGLVSVKKGITNPVNNTDTSRRVAILNHLFAPGKKSTVYIKVRNEGGCPIIVKISGRISQTLNLQTGQEDGFLVPKGNYTISSDVCGNSFQVSKDYQQDISMTLRNR